jgi:hypothetical protein
MDVTVMQMHMAVEHMHVFFEHMQVVGRREAHLGPR